MKKTCSKCKEKKSFDFFHANAAQKDRLHNECKSCRALARGAVERGALPEKRATKKTILITSAEVGVEPVRSYLKAAETFCREHDAELFILGMREQALPLQGQNSYYPKSISEYICRRVLINNNLYAEDLELNPQQKEPLTGLQKFGNAEGRQSVIIAHSKQHLITLGSLTNPRVHATTGCITPSFYLNHTRIGRIATLEHFHGGFIIDILDDDTFIIQNFEFKDDGTITNYGNKYHSNGKVTKDECEAIVCGDWHVDSYKTQQNVFSSDNFRILKEQAEYFNKPQLVYHDLSSWENTSHHNRNDTRYNSKYQYQETLKLIGGFLFKSYCLSNKEVLIVKSNHDDHVGNYLKAGDFRDAGHSLEIICRHAANYIQSGDPYSMVSDGLSDYISPSNDFKIAGCTISLHGHKGSAGKKGSLKAIEQDVPNCVIGHSHSPSIRNYSIQVGYNGLDQEYAADAPSNWLQANCFIYKSGFKQLCISVGGFWLPERIKL